MKHKRFKPVPLWQRLAQRAKAALWFVSEWLIAALVVLMVGLYLACLWIGEGQYVWRRWN